MAVPAIACGASIEWGGERLGSGLAGPAHAARTMAMASVEPVTAVKRKERILRRLPSPPRKGSTVEADKAYALELRRLCGRE